jgi:sporulation protein YlmC with PRC-barrel domain
MIRASDLEGKTVRREDGEVLGVVFELRVEDGQLQTLIFGRRGFWQRLGSSRGGHRVDWHDVVRITADEIVIAPADAASAA